MPLEPFETRYVDFGHGPVHIADLGGEGPPVVCVHGLGGSHTNWVSAAPHLRSLGHVTALDFPGFGLTPPAGRSAGVVSARRLLDGYLASLGRPATVVANSMGGAIAVFQAAEAPATVERLVLVSPAGPLVPGEPIDPVVKALFLGYALPGIAPLLVAGRRSLIDPALVARWILELCAARPSRIEPEVYGLHVALAAQRRHLPGVDRAFIQAARSVLGLVARRGAYDRRVAAIVCPTLIVHGKRDRLVRHQSSLRLGALRPDWDVELLEDVGHVAMLEVPATFGRLVAEWADAPAAA